jgi:hypothetical protein
MFYISSTKRNTYGVTDSTDGVEEFYTRDQILAMVYENHIKIRGVSHGMISMQNPDLDYEAVLDQLEPLNNKVRKICMLAHPSDDQAEEAYNGICEYIKKKYKRIYSREEIRYRFTKDANYWFEMVVDENGDIAIACGNMGSKEPFGWYPTECDAWNTIHTFDKWTANNSHQYFKGIRKLVKNWYRIQRYLDALV